MNVCEADMSGLSGHVIDLGCPGCGLVNGAEKEFLREHSSHLGVSNEK